MRKGGHEVRVSALQSLCRSQGTGCLPCERPQLPSGGPLQVCSLLSISPGVTMASSPLTTMTLVCCLS